MANSSSRSQASQKQSAPLRKRRQKKQDILKVDDSGIDSEKLKKRIEQLKLLLSNEKKKTRLTLFIILTICAFLLASFFALAIVFAPVSQNKSNSEQSKYKIPCIDETIAVPQTSDITIRVMNASGKAGIGTAVAESFKNRGFNVAEVGTASFRSATTQVRYGANAAVQARVVAENLMEHTLILDDRNDGLIDVVIGGLFTDLLDTDLVTTSSRTAKLEQIPSCVDADFIPREKALIHDVDLVPSYSDKKADGDETE